MPEVTAREYVAQLRSKTDPVIHAHARIAMARETAARVHRLAFSAEQASAANSVSECAFLLSALDAAMAMLDEHVHAAKRGSAERVA